MGEAVQQNNELNAQEIWRLFKETDRKFQETDLKFKKTDREITRLERLFTGQWGKLMEALVKPGILKLFQDRGIHVFQIYQRAESNVNGKQMEIDLLLGNGDICVVIEVKTSLKIENVKDLMERLQEFPTFFPAYKDKIIYGAVAGLTLEESSDKYAYRNGLFVLSIGKNDMVTMLNDQKFLPKDFNMS